MTEHDTDSHLDALWRNQEVPAPPADFADRVLVAHARERRLRRVFVAAGTVAACVAVAALFAVRAPRTGDVTADARTSIALGSNVTAVLEAGTQLRFQVTGMFHDDVRVEQLAGHAFYRVDRGTPVIIHTSAGDVSVHGTCFTVDLTPPSATPQETAMSTLALAHKLPSVAAGALLGAVLSVAVLEGSVHVGNAQGSVALGPGDAARATAQGAPQLVPNLATESTALRALRRENEDLRASLDNAQRAAGGDVQQLLADNRALREEARATEAALHTVQADREQKEGKALPFPKDLPPRFSQDQLLQAFSAAFKEAGVPGDVTHIDCDEFPCIVYGEAKLGSDADSAKLRDRLQEAPALAAYHDDSNNTSWWRSISKDKTTGEPIEETQFGVALWPKDTAGSGTDGADAEEAVSKRISFRNQQMWDGSRAQR